MWTTQFFLVPLLFFSSVANIRFQPSQLWNFDLKPTPSFLSGGILRFWGSLTFYKFKVSFLSVPFSLSHLLLSRHGLLCVLTLFLEIVPTLWSWADLKLFAVSHPEPDIWCVQGLLSAGSDSIVEPPWQSKSSSNPVTCKLVPSLLQFVTATFLNLAAQRQAGINHSEVSAGRNGLKFIVLKQLTQNIKLLLTCLAARWQETTCFSGLSQVELVVTENPPANAGRRQRQCLRVPGGGLAIHSRVLSGSAWTEEPGETTIYEAEKWDMTGPTYARTHLLFCLLEKGCCLAACITCTHLCWRSQRVSTVWNFWVWT